MNKLIVVHNITEAEKLMDEGWELVTANDYRHMSFVLKKVKPYDP